jgi:hypothetical protein
LLHPNTHNVGHTLICRRLFRTNLVSHRRVIKRSRIDHDVQSCPVANHILRRSDSLNTPQEDE